jgi:hypothetical protein
MNNDSVFTEVHRALDRLFSAYNDMNRWQARTPQRYADYKRAQSEYISAYIVAYGVVPRNIQ